MVYEYTSAYNVQILLYNYLNHGRTPALPLPLRDIGFSLWLDWPFTGSILTISKDAFHDEQGWNMEYEIYGFKNIEMMSDVWLVACEFLDWFVLKVH